MSLFHLTVRNIDGTRVNAVFISAEGDFQFRTAAVKARWGTSEILRVVAVPLFLRGRTVAVGGIDSGRRRCGERAPGGGGAAGMGERRRKAWVRRRYRRVHRPAFATLAVGCVVIYESIDIVNTEKSMSRVGTDAGVLGRSLWFPLSSARRVRRGGFSGALPASLAGAG